MSKETLTVLKFRLMLPGFWIEAVIVIVVSSVAVAGKNMFVIVKSGRKQMWVHLVLLVSFQFPVSQVLFVPELL